MNVLESAVIAMITVQSAAPYEIERGAAKYIGILNGSLVGQFSAVARCRTADPREMEITFSLVANEREMMGEFRLLDAEITRFCSDEL